MKKTVFAITLIIAITITAVVSIALVFFYSAPDISAVAIESTEPSWTMVQSGRFEQSYLFKVSLSIEINNPTAYKVIIRLQGECEFTVITDSNYLKAGTYSYINTADFVLFPYSKHNYTLLVYEYPFSALDPDSIKALYFDNYCVYELEREICEW